jgi:hypothetical protein
MLWYYPIDSAEECQVLGQSIPPRMSEVGFLLSRLVASHLGGKNFCNLCDDLASAVSDNFYRSTDKQVSV